MIPNFPYHIEGNLINGTAIPCRGMLFGEAAEAVPGDPTKAVLRWKESLPANLSDADITRQLYVNGEWKQSQPAGPPMTATDLRTDQYSNLDVLLVSNGEENAGLTSAMFYATSRGKRIHLSWTDQPTADDFQAYLIYWDAGDGLGPDTLLATIYGIDQLEYVTAELADGSYEFRLTYKDITGNIRADLAVYTSATVDSPPLAVDTPAVGYDMPTRIATLTWAQPGGQDADVVGVMIFDNWVAGFTDLADAPCVNLRFARAFVAAGILTWDSGELWEGIHRWAICAVDAHGNLSDWTELTLTLVLDVTDLEQVMNPPVGTPDLLLAEPQAGGTIKLTARWLGSGAVSLRIYQDAALAKTLGVADSGTAGVGGNTTYTVISNTVTILTLAENLTGAAATYSLASGLQTYTWTTAALTDGVEYDYYVTPWNSGGEGTQSNTLSATADSTAPSGDQVLTAEVVE